MDIALAIEKLVPRARYGGSTTSNTRSQFESLRWEDDRKKPTWKQLEKAWSDVESDLTRNTEKEQEEKLIDERVRKIARDQLVAEGAITDELSKE